jgi:type VI secretion system protein
MRERSLIERLRERGHSAPTTRLNISALTDSVLRHLDRMLNSRQGISQTVPDYGLPDLADVVHSFPEAIDVCRRSIRTSIEKYEPRMRNVVVNHVADPDDIFHLRFEIKGQLVTERETVPVSFYTTLDATGHSDVKR